MQVIVTSYARPKYLKPTIESLRQDKIELYVVDGGSDPETCEYIRSVADGALFFQGNPGADFLKTEGIKAFATEPEVIISSDDLGFPAGYSTLMMEQYRKLNQYGLKWTFVACNLDWIAASFCHEFVPVNGVRIREVGVSQVAGAILDVEVCKAVGYFPVQYGKTGLGDCALSKRLRQRGLRLCYLWEPCLAHLGQTKDQDYPEYTQKFRSAENNDLWKAACGDLWR